MIDLAGGLVEAGEEAAHHDAVAPAAMALVMSPEWRMPPSAMTGTPAGSGDADRVEDRGDLRHADAAR